MGTEVRHGVYLSVSLSLRQVREDALVNSLLLPGGGASLVPCSFSGTNLEAPET